MNKSSSTFSKNLKLTVILFLAFFLSSCAILSHQEQLTHQLGNHSLVVKSPSGEIVYTALPGDAIEVLHLQSGEKEFPSFAKKELVNSVEAKVVESDRFITFQNGNLSAVINKSDFSVVFYRDSELLVRQKKPILSKEKIVFDFELDDSEKIMGGGERVLGMDRRGHRMPLYNRAHYGYNTESNQMSFSLPAIMSDKKYLVLFDNSASGYLDIGKTEKNTLSFEAVGGRNAYIVFSAKTYPKLINNYVDVTGKQPMLPRWAFGNFASRFGYKNQQQVLDIVDKFKHEDFPLDSVIIDLYWFGSDIKGHVGNLDWDKTTFPAPLKMIKELKQQHINTILVTEPFILSTSSKWQEAVDQKILAKDEHGDAKRFDFYFGNTGLIDVFDKKSQDWFSKIYTDLSMQGIAGVWGDLGEPEVHPDDSFHFISENNMKVTGDLIHNAYGHQWAKMVYENQLKIQPKLRPFIMMRSGFSGSQRYGMIPWTGDVDRSWDGLKPQVELSLQMGLFGMGYTHSDLGGFAGGEVFDKEMYIRWLQYGVFQPIYRPHAQDHIAPEPVFHDQQTKDILRDFIKLRYRMLPYIYTMAYQNSTTGMPLMRPMFFEDEADKNLIDVKNSYLWGDALLVSPIMVANETTHKIKLPKGVWFDFWNDTRYDGNRLVTLPTSLETLPVMVRGGSFIPMINEINNTQNYSSQNLVLHYYADNSVSSSSGMMYEDDGVSRSSLENNEFELLEFSSKQNERQLSIHLSRKKNEYTGSPQQRKLEVVIHHWKTKPKKIQFLGGSISHKNYTYDQQTKTVRVLITWDHDDAELTLE